MKKKTMEAIFNKYSLPLGFGGWGYRFERDNSKKEVGDDIACIYTDLYNKTLTIKFTPQFYKECEVYQKNVIIHELIHARVQVSQLRSEKLRSQEEELMVNDIVNCVEEATRK